MNYKIVRPLEAFERDLLFRSLDRIGTVDLDKYVVTYSADITDVGSDAAVLETLFQIFNTDHPADFRQHSMSVGDIVVLDGARFWFCDSIGWVQLTGDNAPKPNSRLSLLNVRRPA
jgi:YodL-like protein